MLAGLAMLAAAVLLGSRRADSEALRARLATAAQKVYDEWDEDEDEYAGGGICHLIADAMADVLMAEGIKQVSTVSQQMDEVHVYVVAADDSGVYRIDIPPSVYETGGGYTWKKRQGIEITADDVEIDRLSTDPDDYEQYTEE